METELYLRTFTFLAKKVGGMYIATERMLILDEGVYEMGWIYNRRFWRQGYAYESCKAVIDYAFGKLKAHKLFAEAIDAVRSVGLMKKLGMQLEGIQRSQTKDHHGRWADLYLYGLLEDD